MKLFGGPVAWRASKQDTITTSSTEAELLALSSTAKELRAIERLFAGLCLTLDTEKLSIYYDNVQTLRIITADAFHLNTRLKHVDIHQHWLRQEYQEGRIDVKWMKTDDIPADGLTKFLPKDKFHKFVNQLGMVDLTEVIRELGNSGN
jgi:hypothetical protein